MVCERAENEKWPGGLGRFGSVGEGNDLLTGNRGSDLYTNTLQETTYITLIWFHAKASPTQAWLWHRRLSHLNFDYITLLSKKDIVTGLPKLTYVKDQLCSSCEMSKAKRSSFKSKAVPSSKGRLNLLHMDLGTEFLSKTLLAYFKEEGIEHQTSTPRTPEQNGVVERRNRTLVEAARTMLSASKLPLSFWAEAARSSRTKGVNYTTLTSWTPCPRQNVVPTAEKTDSSQQGLEFLFSPLLEEYYNPTHGLAEDNNNNQAPNASFQEAEFINPFCTRNKFGKSNPSQIKQDDTCQDPEMCMFALETVSIVESKNIKEAMADSAWIEAMQEELHQFDRLKV
ncbi:retrovirus-related pol polyprotein from transposon TNT 1-94 [Tanacetum coccineum]